MHATSEPVVERKEPVRNQSSLLESVTDFNDEVIERVKHAAGPLSLLVPYEGVNNYLKVVNDYDKQPTWLDRLGLFWTKLLTTALTTVCVFAGVLTCLESGCEPAKTLAIDPPVRSNRVRDAVQRPIKNGLYKPFAWFLTKALKRLLHAILNDEAGLCFIAEMVCLQPASANPIKSPVLPTQGGGRVVPGNRSLIVSLHWHTARTSSERTHG